MRKSRFTEEQEFAIPWEFEPVHRLRSLFIAREAAQRRSTTSSSSRSCDTAADQCSRPHRPTSTSVVAEYNEGSAPFARARIERTHEIEFTILIEIMENERSG